MGWNSSSTWISSIVGYEMDWMFNTPRVQVRGSRSQNSIFDISYTDISYNWNPSKSYQIRTNTVGVYATSGSFSVSPNWNDRLYYIQGVTPSSTVPSTTQSFFHYSTPTTNLHNTTYAKIKANGIFGTAGSANEGIVGIEVVELDFIMQGFSYYKILGNELQSTTTNSLGWYYDKSQDIYAWYDRIEKDTISFDNSSILLSSQINEGLYPVGGNIGFKTAHFGYRLNNFLAKNIPYSHFNLSFLYQNDSNSPLKIYLGNKPPSTPPSDYYSLVSGVYPRTGTLLATLTQSIITQSYQFYGLKGNQYLYFVGAYVGATGSTYSNIYLKNINIEGGYHPGNNRRYLTTNGSTYSYPTSLSPIGLIGATYTAFVGSGNTINSTQSLNVNEVFSKIGNGRFMSGIWENGVWNSGWRKDDNMFEFYNISLFFTHNQSKRWRLQISGPTSSVSSLEIGDIISIGNIISIDINEERKLLKNHFTIMNKSADSIVVEFDSNFPIRRIQKDSEFHRIYITKNVWLSGGFLNGYFTGVWNYGLFKGYPLITEMYDTQWIDGFFDGGHFSTTKYIIPNFVGTIFQSGSKISAVNITTQSFTIDVENINQETANFVGKVGLTFSSKHGLAVGDIITIDKDDKTVNPQYDGDTYVSNIINDYHVITNINWGTDIYNESGKVTINLSKGVIQKMNFKSNNISSTTSLQSQYTDSVFMFNSWMDVNYYDTSSVNIGKPISINSPSPSGLKDYSENNLYGYPTLDILDSSSTFRDSYSNTVRRYRLGTKYKKFYNYIGDSGLFQEFFGPTSEGISIFTNLGWTFSQLGGGSLTFSRTTGDEYQYQDVVGFKGQELKVEAADKGGILELQTPSIDILNRNNDEIEKYRYTMVEFDILTFSNVNYIFNTISPISSNKDFNPKIHFNNLNLKTVDSNISFTFLNNPFTFTFKSDSLFSYLPISKNIEHTLTPNMKKIDYFYNKRNLSMNFRGNLDGSTSTYIIDNLAFYEVDMIPFFQYFTDVNINKGISVPFQGISPLIDYSNPYFNFIDNILIGLDSIQTRNSFTPISGVGIGIGSTTNTSTIIYNNSGI